MWNPTEVAITDFSEHSPPSYPCKCSKCTSEVTGSRELQASCVRQGWGCLLFGTAGTSGPNTGQNQAQQSRWQQPWQSVSSKGENISQDKEWGKKMRETTVWTLMSEREFTLNFRSWKHTFEFLFKNLTTCLLEIVPSRNKIIIIYNYIYWNNIVQISFSV